MWYRINESMVIIQSIERDRVIIRVFEDGELIQTKKFKTQTQAQTYIALQQRLKSPLECTEYKDSEHELNKLKKQEDR